MPTTCAVVVDHRAGVDAPVDQRPHGVLRRCRRGEGEHVGGHQVGDGQSRSSRSPVSRSGPGHQAVRTSSARAAGRWATTSPATRPRRQARAPARPWRNAPAAAARSGARPWAQQRGDDAGEHVAGAGGGQAGVAGGARRAPRRRGAATTVVGPLSSTTAPVGAASARAASRRSAPGGVAGQARELAVVGREHDRGAASPAARATRVAGRARSRPSPSTTSGHASTAGHAARRTSRGGAVAGAQAGPDDQRPEPVERRRAPRRPSPSAGRATCRRPRSGAGGSAPPPGVLQPHVAGAGPLGPAAGEVGGAGHARRAGHDPHRAPATCGRPAPGRAASAATSAASTRWARAADDVEADVGHLDLAGQGRRRRRAAAPA